MHLRFFLYSIISLATTAIFFFPHPFASLRAGISGGASCIACDDAIRENDVLRTRIAQFQKSGIIQSSKEFSKISAFVYSRFPFNFRDQVFVAAGSSEGVTLTSVAVLVGAATETNSSTDIESSVLVGAVSDVWEHTSQVTTLFDPSWKSEVRVGSQGIQALLQGGLSPSLLFIPKNSPISIGDSIYNTDSRFPYGITIGQIRSISDGADNSFKEAEIKFAYDPSDLFQIAFIKQ